MDSDIRKTLDSLHSRHLNGLYSQNSEEAKSKILDLIIKDAVVGIGDSTTVRQIGVVDELKKRGTSVFDGFDQKIAYSTIKDWSELHYRLVEESTMCDVFLTGTNAITLDGRLVNVDSAGNRVAGMFWGHPMTIIVIGRNKIAKNLDVAFHRIRNVIAPNHIRIRSVELGGLQFETPCVATGKCNDCRARDRACNVFTIIEGKPFRTDVNVMIVNEDLGLSWDQSWPQERVNMIIKRYRKFVWIPPSAGRASGSKASEFPESKE